MHSYVDRLAATAARCDSNGGTEAVADEGDEDGVTYVGRSSYQDALRVRSDRAGALPCSTRSLLHSSGA